MKQFYLLILLLLSASIYSEAQSRYIIQFTDKHNSPYSISKPTAFLSVKSVQRRYRQNITIDSSDLPVNPLYIDSILKLQSTTLVNSSKWLNQILIQIADESVLQNIAGYSFVKSFKKISYNPTAKKSDEIGNRPVPRKLKANNIVLEQSGTAEDTINYGNNYPQIHIHEGEYLHKLGLRGQGMMIAMLDGGYFQYKTNPAFDSIRLNNQIVGEYDFVVNETSVNEDNVHGAICLSTMAANRPGVMVGTAPNANYLLFRTEDVASETPAEEQYWIAGLERADSIGADLISSSLGYTNFDDPQFNHAYQDRDGNTTAITIAADLAVRKGMIVMNAAGNSGNSSNDSKFVMCPADGDSVVAVGAVNTSGMIAAFSCWGPSGSGKTKPNIVSVGAGAVYANTSGNTSTANGTSLATPNIAGLIACLWQAFPDFTNMEIIDAVQRSADRFNNPDDRYGNGIPNFRIAYNQLLNLREEKLNNRLKNSWITVQPVPFDRSFNVLLKAPASGSAIIKLIDISGRIVYIKNMELIANNYYNVDVYPPYLSSGIYYLYYADGKNSETLKLIRK